MCVCVCVCHSCCLGEKFVWLELFIDGFGSFTTRTRSTTGVYLSFANLRHSFKFNRKYIYTYMLIPPGIGLREALAPLVAELKALETSGLEVRMYPSGKRETIHGAVAYIMSDHDQACKTIKHAGNNALKNCRVCLVDKKDRSTYTIKILDDHMRRTEDQSSSLRKYAESIYGANPTTAQASEFVRATGIYLQPSVFHSVLDVHQLTIPCVGHCFELGLGERLTRAMVLEVKESRFHILLKRLAAVEWPSEWAAVSISMITGKGKLSQPMSSSRKIAMATPSIFEGLVHPELINISMRLQKLRGMAVKYGHTQTTVLETQEYGRKWIEDALQLAQTGKYKLKLDLPNMHLLIEILVRFLPMTMDMRSPMTNRMEAHHSTPKGLMKRTLNSTGGAPERFALRQSNIIVSFRSAMEGAGFGPERIGSGFAELLTSEKGQFKPHELFHGIDMSGEMARTQDTKLPIELEEDDPPSDEAAVDASNPSDQEPEISSADEQVEIGQLIESLNDHDYKSVERNTEEDQKGGGDEDSSESDGSDSGNEDGVGSWSNEENDLQDEPFEACDDDSSVYTPEASDECPETDTPDSTESEDEDEKDLNDCKVEEPDTKAGGAGRVVMQSEWEATYNVRIEVKGFVNKQVDRHTPNESELKQIQAAINEYYREHPVKLRNLSKSQLRFRWVRGFRLVDDRSASYGVNSYVAVNEVKERQYAQIRSCLEIEAQGYVYFFMFVRWFERIGESSLKPGRITPPLVREWPKNKIAKPITPRSLLNKVFVVHNCVRFCNRLSPQRVFESNCPSPLTCRCNRKCMLKPYCTLHNSSTCQPSVCGFVNFIYKDIHHPDIKEYMVFDLEWGFQNVL
jgi:hypothetical protein